TGTAPPTRAAVGRDALIPPHPAPPRTPRADMESAPTTNGGRGGQPGNFGPTGMAPSTRAAVGRDALIPPHPAPPRTLAGGYGLPPVSQRRAGGQPGNRCPCVIIHLCRGRCSHRPGEPCPAACPPLPIRAK